MSIGFARGGGEPVMPDGTEIAAYRSYVEASKAVDTLIEAGFPPRAVTIVGSNVHVVEKVVGKLSPGRVAVMGAGRGMTWGLLLALVVMLTSDNIPVFIPLLAVVAGIGAGVLLSVITWATSRNSKGFAAQAQLVATRYAILTSEQNDRAYQLLERTPGNLVHGRRRVKARAERSGPTEFGSRPDEKPKFGVRLSDQKTGPDTTGVSEEPPETPSAWRAEVDVGEEQPTNEPGE